MAEYLESFSLARAYDEDSFVLSYPYKLEMRCFADNVYPFKLFPQKGLKDIRFAPVTIFYGGNGSGKSTLLNVIAEKLRLARKAPFNRTPFFEDYLALCSYRLHGEALPAASRIITSDDVFDYLLTLRSVNEGIDRKRDALFAAYEEMTAPKDEPTLLMSLDEYDAFKEQLDAKRQSKSRYVADRLPKEKRMRSNGESAFFYFTEQIGEGALYLLDEPENSLSFALQKELATFIEDSARFYGCQFVISTHSPFLLSLPQARVYDLDANPVCEKRWTELENVRSMFAFFEAHRHMFEVSEKDLPK